MLSFSKSKFSDADLLHTRSYTYQGWPSLAVNYGHVLNTTDLIQRCAAGSEKSYLADIKPIAQVFSMKNISMQLMKAFLFPAQMVLNEMNQHALESLELEEHERTDFDFNAAVARHMPQFLPLSIRFLTVSALKSCVEWIAVSTLPIRIADRLSKDVGKSITRKLERFSRFTACYKITYTAMWSALPMNIALFAYDMWLHIFTTYIMPSDDDDEKRTLVERLKNSGVFCIKKLGFYGVCISFNALGYGIGSYIHTTQGGFWVSSGLELFAGTAFAAIVGV